MLRVVVVDDEKLAREAIIGMGRSHLTDFQLVGEADSVKSGWEIIHATQPDLVLLDIKLPDGSGFDLLDKFELPLPFKVIFITAYEEYAVQAIRRSAIDYLLKPVDSQELVTSIQRARHHLSLEKFNQGLQTLRNLYQPGNRDRETVLLKTNQVVRRLFADEIMRISGDGNYCNILLVTGEVIRLAKTLNKLEEELIPKGFIRTHKQHIVNIAFVKSFLKNEQVLILADGSRVPVSFRKRSEVLDALGRSAGTE
ncbi:MAG: LytR/AlgR family response regulator transcription factor [Bacteroidales bacterium]